MDILIFLCGHLNVHDRTSGLQQSLQCLFNKNAIIPKERSAKQGLTDLPCILYLIVVWQVNLQWCNEDYLTNIGSHFIFYESLIWKSGKYSENSGNSGKRSEKTGNSTWHFGVDSLTLR